MLISNIGCKETACTLHIHRTDKHSVKFQTFQINIKPNNKHSVEFWTFQINIKPNNKHSAKFWTFQINTITKPNNKHSVKFWTFQINIQTKQQTFSQVLNLPNQCPNQTTRLGGGRERFSSSPFPFFWASITLPPQHYSQHALPHQSQNQGQSQCAAGTLHTLIQWVGDCSAGTGWHLRGAGGFTFCMNLVWHCPPSPSPIPCFFAMFLFTDCSLTLWVVPYVARFGSCHFPCALHLVPHSDVT